MDFLDIVDVLEPEEIDTYHDLLVVEKSPVVKPMRMSLHGLYSALDNSSEVGEISEELQEHENNTSVHFEKGSISHNDLQDRGDNSHSTLDGHLLSSNVHVNKNAWVNMTLENGWTQVAGKRTAAYKILATGVIVFKGRICGTNSTSGVFFTLPVGSRPGAVADIVVWGDGTPTLVTVNSSGQCAAAVSNIAAVSIENITLSV